MSGVPNVLPYDKFVRAFRPVSQGIVEGEPSRPMFATYGKDLAHVRSTNERHVWTIIDVDLTDGYPHPYVDEDGDNCWVIVAGYHYVNRLGYMITEIPWGSSDIEVVY